MSRPKDILSNEQVVDTISRLTSADEVVEESDKTVPLTKNYQVGQLNLSFSVFVRWLWNDVVVVATTVSTFSSSDIVDGCLDRSMKCANISSVFFSVFLDVCIGKRE